MTTFDLLVKNAFLVTPLGSKAKAGDKQGEVFMMPEAMIGINKQQIAYVGSANQDYHGDTEIDCKGSVVTPGLVDSHTHLVFGGWRSDEFDRKLKGESYLDILRSGGGILSTVRATRKASFLELEKKTRYFLKLMFDLGVTTLEAKSGYGLDYENEKKQLLITRKLNGHPVELVNTFLGAHAVPQEYLEDRKAYIDLLCETIIPKIKAEGLAEFCDVFCEHGVFSNEESERILKAAKAAGLSLKAHVDELEGGQGAQLAAKMACVSAEHLIAADDAGIEALAKSGTIAVLLPCTSLYLDKGYARAREMIDAGVAVAIASDFNPGSTPSPNLQLAMNLGCLKYRMTPNEVLCAVTLNAAASIDRADCIGTIEPGKQADLVIWDTLQFPMIFYRYGFNQTGAVIKKGKLFRWRRRK